MAMHRHIVALSCLLLIACSGDDGGSLGPSGSSGSSGSSGDPSSSGGPGGSSGSSGTGGGSSGTSGSSGSSAGTLAAGKTTKTYSVAGKERSVLLVVPEVVATKKLPLVIALHGNGDTNTSFVTVTTKLESIAGSKGFALAAPQGISQTIAIGNQTINVNWDAYRAKSAGNIDLPLLDAIREDLVATGSIDATKVFTLGYSQGGYLSFRYGMDTAALVSCAAVLAAANPIGPSLTAAAARKVPVALQIGTKDGAINQARSTKADLESKQFPLDYREIENAGHVPVPGDLNVPLDYCLGQTKP
jgi:poly(3-hydroxybutyrate) depolymerase